MSAFNLTKLFKESRQIIHIENYDEHVFLDSVISSLFFSDNRKIEHSILKRHYKDFNIEGLEFPLKLKKIQQFVTQNRRYNLRLNIFIVELDVKKEAHVFPLKAFGDINGVEVNLLAIKEEKDILLKDDECAFTFFAIKNLDAFLAIRYENENGANYRQTVHYCRLCFYPFRTVESRRNHMEHCTGTGEQRIVYPEETDEGAPNVKFQKKDKFNPYQIVGFADFESYLRKESSICETCKSEKCLCDTSHTEVIQTHEPSAYSLVFVDFAGEIIHQRVYSGENVVEHFVDEITKSRNIIKELCQQHKHNITMTEEDKKKFDEASVCYICGKEFEFIESKFRDHCHYSSKFLGAAHKSCNLARRIQSKIPIFIHNLSGYDSHLIIKHIEKKPRQYQVFAKNTEKIRAIGKIVIKNLENLFPRDRPTLREVFFFFS